MRQHLPIRVRLWQWRHRHHGPQTLNTGISVPSFDPSALGILTRCERGHIGAW